MRVLSGSFFSFSFFKLLLVFLIFLSSYSRKLLQVKEESHKFEGVHNRCLIRVPFRVIENWN
jgi:hypothetical protein